MAGTKRDTIMNVLEKSASILNILWINSTQCPYIVMSHNSHLKHKNKRSAQVISSSSSESNILGGSAVNRLCAVCIPGHQAVLRWSQSRRVHWIAAEPSSVSHLPGSCSGAHFAAALCQHSPTPSLKPSSSWQPKAPTPTLSPDSFMANWAI